MNSKSKTADKVKTMRNVLVILEGIAGIIELVMMFKLGGASGGFAIVMLIGIAALAFMACTTWIMLTYFSETLELAASNSGDLVVIKELVDKIEKDWMDK